MEERLTTLITAEGFAGEVEDLAGAEDVWPYLYASRQHRTVVQAECTGLTDVEVAGKTAPCLLFNMNGVKGMMPLQEADVEVTGDPARDRAKLRKLVGRRVAFVVVDLDREAGVATLSRKQARERMARYTWERIKEGEIRTAVVQEVYPRHLVADVGGVTVRLKAEDLSWCWIEDVRDEFEVGQAIRVKVVAVDRENQRLVVSRREAMPNPWETVADRFKVGNEYAGVVTGLQPYGTFVRLGDVDALVVNPPNADLRPRIGDKVVVRITEIKPEKRYLHGYIHPDSLRLRRRPGFVTLRRRGG